MSLGGETTPLLTGRGKGRSQYHYLGVVKGGINVNILILTNRICHPRVTL